MNFSSFGTLPKASNDTIVLNEVVEHIHDLFQKKRGYGYTNGRAHE
jgi:hypothetical protein